MEDIVKIALTSIDGGKDIVIDDRLPTLCDGTPRWLWAAHQALNKKDIVQKVSLSRLKQSPFD
jgi:hypothetical protein